MDNPAAKLFGVGKRKIKRIVDEVDIVEPGRDELFQPIGDRIWGACSCRPSLGGASRTEACKPWGNRGGFGGTFTGRWGLRLSPFVNLQSGRPFNIVTSQDVYGDTLLTARPGIASNASQPDVLSTPYGLLDPNPTPGEAILPRNYGRSPGQFNANVRLSKTFGFGPERASSGPPAGGGTATPLRRYNLIFAISARNVFNYVNRGPVVGNINSPFFGESTQIAGGFGAFGGNSNNRRLELQVRFSF